MPNSIENSKLESPGEKLSNRKNSAWRKRRTRNKKKLRKRHLNLLQRNKREIKSMRITLLTKMNNRLPRKKKRNRPKNRATKLLPRLLPTTCKKMTPMIMEILILMTMKRLSHKRLFKIKLRKLKRNKSNHRPSHRKLQLSKSRSQLVTCKKRLKVNLWKRIKLWDNWKTKKQKLRKLMNMQSKTKSSSHTSMTKKELWWRRKWSPTINSSNNKSSLRLISRRNLTNSMRFLKRQVRRMWNIVTNSLEHKMLIIILSMKCTILLNKIKLPICQRKLRT